MKERGFSTSQIFPSLKDTAAAIFGIVRTYAPAGNTRREVLAFVCSLQDTRDALHTFRSEERRASFPARGTNRDRYGLFIPVTSAFKTRARMIKVEDPISRVRESA